MSRIDVLQATAWYPPYDLGGTEIYLEGLVAGLAEYGVKCGVLVPRHANAPDSYLHQGCPVETYPVNQIPEPYEIKQQQTHSNFNDFRERLLGHRHAIYHQHSWTRGCGAPHLKAARDLGMRTVVTVHIPSTICLRGTMLLHGVQPCDGRIDDKRCGACWAESQGAPQLLARGLAHFPLSAAKVMRSVPTRVATALSARALGAAHKAMLHDMIGNADRVVAVCQWLYDALLLNGAPRDKLVLSRQGVAMDFLTPGQAARQRTREKSPLRLLFVGRLSKVKGIDVIIRAVAALPVTCDVRLTIHAIPASGEEDYAEKILALAATDNRIEIGEPVERSQLPALMAEHDILVVPSQCLETGPLVVLEAQASGLFVLGSRLGGIAELVEEPNGGLLVEPNDINAWRSAIQRLATRHDTNALSPSRRPVRTMQIAAKEMADLYHNVLHL